MAKSSFKLDTRRPLKDGTFPIVLNVGYSRNMLLSTGLSATPDNWDRKTQILTGPHARSANAVLTAQMTAVTVRILELRASGMFDRLDNAHLRALLTDTEAKPPKNMRNSLRDLFEALIQTKAQRTGEIYSATLKRLETYCDPSDVRFEDINRPWLDGFVASMRDLAPNTKSIHLRNLRAVNNYAIDCEATKSYPFRRYSMPKTTTRKRALAVDTIRNIARLQLGHNSIYRDIFMLTFYLIGINFVDLCGLIRVEGGRINYRRAKTHKAYSIKVEPEAAEIIDRLKGQTHLLYMLDNHKDYRSYYRQLRRGLEAVKKAYNEQHTDEPLTELTTYWARHSWATIAASLDIPKETIAHALGHGGDTVTDIYIDFDQRKVDDANRRVIDYVSHG